MPMLWQTRCNSWRRIARSGTGSERQTGRKHGVSTTRKRCSGHIPGCSGPRKRKGRPMPGMVAKVRRDMLEFLVTGGCGFIGSHLTDALLRRGHRVRVLDNLSTGSTANLSSAATLIEGDIRDPAAVADAMTGCDGCFHLAAVASVERSNQEWLETHAVN